MNPKPYNIILLFFICLFTFSACKNSASDADSADKNRSGKTIIETGELAAVDSRAFVMPRFGRWSSTRIIGILDHGEVVNAGDSIIQLDPSNITRNIVERETELESQLATFEKMLVNQANRGSEAESKIRSEMATYELRKLSLEAARFESERTKKIKELEFQQATITMEKQKKIMELTEIINLNDLKIQEIRVRQIQNDIQSMYDILPQMTIRTPIPGIFQILRNYRTGTLIKIGDDVYTGNPMASVPDLTWMKVNTYINENDFLKIAEGQKVIVRLDALPKVTFDGEISYVGKLCKPRDNNNPRQKVFDVEVKILKSDERLKPGMTVSCEFIDAK